RLRWGKLIERITFKRTVVASDVSALDPTKLLLLQRASAIRRELLHPRPIKLAHSPVPLSQIVVCTQEFFERFVSIRAINAGLMLGSAWIKVDALRDRKPGFCYARYHYSH